MIRNEGRYLEEWLQWHRAIGVSSFFLYDNNSTDSTVDILGPCIARGECVLHHWPHAFAQTEALTDCLSRYRARSAWLGFVDVDEYIHVGHAHVHSHSSTAARHSLPRFLRRQQKAAVPMPWVLYCAADLMQPPVKGRYAAYSVTETYRVAQSRFYSYGKQLVRSTDTIALHSFGPHWFRFLGDTARSGEHSDFESADVMHVRHYYAKSREEYVARRQGFDSVFHRWRTPEALGRQWDEYNGNCKRSAERGQPSVCWRGYCEYTSQQL
jgi:hypothetical protein